MRASIFRTVGLCAGLVNAFSMDVHNQIAFMAEEYLTPQARWLTQQILEPWYNGSIGRAAAWADIVAHTSHKYSYTWHFIDALDDPPHVCNIYYNRDCQPHGCVTQQIANQSSILASCAKRLAQGTHKPDVACQEALKWTLHFVGDVAQPLHTSSYDRGGNTFRVKWNGTEVGLHSIWDGLIVHSAVGRPHGFSHLELDPYMAELVERSRADALPMPRDKWLLAGDPSQALYWAQQWAEDSNAINCDFVYGRYRNGSDLYLDNGYAKDAFPIVELQIAKAAWRLGGWLNGIALKYLKPVNVLDQSGSAPRHSMLSLDDL